MNQPNEKIQITYAILNTNFIHVQMENPKLCERISWIQGNIKNKEPMFG